MTSLEAPPPSRHISSTPVSPAAASAMLATYLLNSEAHAHLHPDALITPTGVTFSSHGGPAGGVVLHNLRRVAAGLRGEYLEPEGTPEPEGEEGGDVVAGADGGAWKGKDKGKGKKNAPEWQDAEVVAQQENGLVVGEVGDRTNAVSEGGEVPEVQATDLGGEAGKKRKQEGDSKMSKEARKKAKKERDQQRKRENEAKKAKKAD